jgi:CheY-like chemotaxis protein
MLSSVDRQWRQERNELAIGASLLKPVGMDDLREAIARTLARDGAVRKETRPESYHAKAGSGSRILVVEDTLINQRLIMRVLEKNGYEPVLATDGEQALAILSTTHIDLILMDVQLPDMDGMEVTRRIRSREKRDGGHIPILALTAHAMKDDRDSCLASGMDGYLSKPIKTAELLAAIRQATAPGPSRQVEPAEYHDLLAPVV